MWRVGWKNFLQKTYYPVKKCDLCGGHDFRQIKSLAAKEWEPVKKYYREVREPNPFLKLPEKFELLTCGNCGLVFVDPRITDRVVNKFYDEYLSGKYEGYIQKYDASFREKIFIQYYDTIKHLLPNDNENGKMKSLDIGCATGEFMGITNRAGFTSFGIEVSRIVGERARKYGDVCIGDVVSCLKKLSENTFDFVSLIDSLEHFRSPRQVMSLLHKKMKKNGIVLIETPNYLSGFDEMSRHFYLFTGDTMRKLLRVTGFAVLSLEESRVQYNPNDIERIGRFIKVVACKE